MLEQLVCCSAALDIDAEADAEEGFELPAEFIRVLEARGAIGGDQEKSFERLLVQIRGFGFDHLDGHDSKRPDVDLGTVFFLFDNLGSHPVGSADHGGAFGF